MLSVKELLLKQTAEAFRGRADMPLMASLEGVTEAEACWRVDARTPTIEQVVRHVAWAKSFYCWEAFGTPMLVADPTTNDNGDTLGLSEEFPCGAGWALAAAPGMAGAIGLLEEGHRVLTDRLASLPDDAFEQPLTTRHGKSAAHFFWIMIMHDVYHAGQIRTRRTLYQSLK